MTTALLAQPLTARTFLFGDSPDSISELAGDLDREGILRVAGDALQEMSQSGRAAVGAEVARVVQGLLDLDLGELVVGGWRKWTALTAAARRTRDTPGAAEIVNLAEHTVTSTHEPHVDLLVRELRVATVHAQLTVEFTLRGLAATVRGGQLVAVTGGSCEIAVTLAVEKKTLARKQAHAQLPLIVRLGDGVPLLPAAERLPASPPPPPADPPPVAPKLFVHMPSHHDNDNSDLFEAR
jgi:hypothetical protein